MPRLRTITQEPTIGKIEKNIPVAPLTTALYPFAKMKKGDTFLVTPYSRAVHSSVIGASKHHKSKGQKYTTRKVIENGVLSLRVWRVK